MQASHHIQHHLKSTRKNAQVISCNIINCVLKSSWLTTAALLMRDGDRNDVDCSRLCVSPTTTTIPSATTTSIATWMYTNEIDQTANISLNLYSILAIIACNENEAHLEHFRSVRRWRMQIFSSMFQMKRIHLTSSSTAIPSASHSIASTTTSSASAFCGSDAVAVSDE